MPFISDARRAYAEFFFFADAFANCDSRYQKKKNPKENGLENSKKQPGIR